MRRVVLLLLPMIMLGCTGAIRGAFSSASKAGSGLGSNRGNHFNGTVSITELQPGEYYLTIEAKEVAQAVTKWHQVAKSKCEYGYDGDPKIMESNRSVTRIGNTFVISSDFTATGEFVCRTNEKGE